MSKTGKKNWRVIVVATILLLFVAINYFMYFVHTQEKGAPNEFWVEFNQPVDIKKLDPLARKNREFALWEKMVRTANSIVEDEAAIRIVLDGLDENRDPQKIAEAKIIKERADQNKRRLAKQLYLAWRFGQFENDTQTENYGFIGRLIIDGQLDNWYDISKRVKELKPE